MQRFSFSKESRLRTRLDFQRVFAGGTRVHTRRFILYFLSSELPNARLGVTVSKKVGNAVVRNRVKRCLREAFRLHTLDLGPRVDVVVIAKHKRDSVEKETTSRITQKYTLETVSNEFHYGIRKYRKLVS